MLGIAEGNFLDENRLTLAGLKCLSTINPLNWYNLKELHLGTKINYRGMSKIGNKGVQYLLKANFNKLEKLHLCKAHKI